MSIPALILAISTMVALSWQAVLFHEATVCRQKAWLKGHEFQTRTLLPKVQTREQFFDPVCRVLIKRIEGQVSWVRYPNHKTHLIEINLQGKL